MPKKARYPLPCKLTDDEVAQLATELAQRLCEVEDMDGRRKADATRYREDLKDLREQVQLLARQVYARSIERQVDVIESPDYAAGVVHLVRSDTGEVIETRPATAGDRQMPLLPTESEHDHGLGLEVPQPTRDEDGDAKALPF